MSSQESDSRELVFMTLQFLKDEKHDESVHKLEKESGVFFDMRYFERFLMNGEWEKAEDYLSGFIKAGENTYSSKILFSIRSQKYFEALYKNDQTKAFAILTKELKVISQYGLEESYKHLTLLMTLEDFRYITSLLRLSEWLAAWNAQHEISPNTNKKFACEMEKLIRDNPVFRDKLEFPNLNNSSLTALMNQSLSWYQLRSLTLPDPLLSVKVTRLMYTSSGKKILALTGNGVHKLWKWEQNERNVTGQATASVPPRFCQPESGILMTNNLGETTFEEAVTCLALTKNDSYVMSASGGSISIFNIINFTAMTTCMPPPPAATCLVFDPADSNCIFVGLEDSTIRIYYVLYEQVIQTLRGHRRRVTGLAFSSVFGVLVSSSADAQLCAWDRNGWRRLSQFSPIPQGYASTDLAQTRVQFDKTQTLLLVVLKFQIAIYELPRFELLYQWLSGSLTGAITDATYSSDGKSVYATFKDGSIKVFTAFNLTLRCQINPTSYLPSTVSSMVVYPLVIAAHPSKNNQFAIGLSDGGVYVLEPLEEEGTWGIRV